MRIVVSLVAAVCFVVAAQALPAPKSSSVDNIRQQPLASDAQTPNTLPAPAGHVTTCAEGGPNCRNYPHGDNAYPGDFQDSHRGD